MDLKTEIQQIQTKLVNCTKAEEYYYWTLALKELNGLNMGVSDGENLELLSPSDTSLLGIYSSRTWGDTDCAKSIFGEGYATSYNGIHSAVWYVLNFNERFNDTKQRTVYKYSVSNANDAAQGRLKDFVLEVSNNTTNGTDGDWTIIHEVTNSPNTLRYNQIHQIPNPIPCKMIKIRALSNWGGASYNTISIEDVSYWGKKEI